MNRRNLFHILFMAAAMSLQAQSLENNVQQRLSDFFSNYQTSYAHIGTCRLDNVEINHEEKAVSIYANPTFGYQPFTEENVQAIYRSIKQVLPGPVNYYRLTVYADGQPIENLIPNAFRSRTKKDKSRLYTQADRPVAPWVENISRPYTISRGLQNRHLAVWQSHGRFYKQSKGEWVWQRPRLFATTEDLFTQSIVVPYLIPMLENAGAVVFTPRERDWQRNEVIVDNNTSTRGSSYLEINYKRKYRWQESQLPGFAQKYQAYPENHNPFTDGTARFIRTLPKPEKAFAEWIPNIPETGRYAVYVSYQTLPESVSDAKYLVFHKGGVTEFKVNQQIGGGTWVYLGTFEFDRGHNDYGMVVLSNESKQDGVVCADAVRFGGGMGNILRGGQTSGMPRYLEGARYWGQWAGMPYSVYSKSQGENDYNDDINARSLMVNYLNGGSVYNPGEKGLGVPLELTLGMHSDAGFKKDDALVGSLGIYTTGFNDGKLNSGISRYASRDLNDLVLTGLQRDISSRMGVEWARRGMWNRNYSETRLPSVPSMILETLSHQNFSDMQLGHDPAFKFVVARSVYKSLLRFTAEMHRKEYTVQPLPVDHFAIREGEKKNTFRLTWNPVSDPLEPTAEPQGYVVYTRIGYGGFDNGTYTRNPELTVKAEPGLVYSFKVTAVNRGGESFPSEILSAYRAKKSRGTILIVNGFHRVSGPASFSTATQQGFDLQTDPGVPYLRTPEYCGYQQDFDRSKAGIETKGGLGYSGSELEGTLMAGNTFDYPFVHGKAIQHAGGYSFVSCSSETLESGSVSPEEYPIVDFIYGAEKAPLSSRVQEVLTQYCRQGGNLLLSGAYLGNLGSPSFMSQTLKYTYGGSLKHLFSGEVSGAGIRFRVPRTPNEQVYAISAPDCILPSEGAYASFVSTEGGYGAGTAYQGKDYRTFVLGVPLEAITEADYRTHLLRAALQFFGYPEK